MNIDELKQDLSDIECHIKSLKSLIEEYDNGITSIDDDTLNGLKSQLSDLERQADILRNIIENESN